MVAVSASSDPDRATMTTTSSSQRSQASSLLTDVSQVPIYNINTCVEFSMLHQVRPSESLRQRGFSCRLFVP
jgi:hypothetical protein